uniref:Uncharacterized protein n=1 Tax=Arundo donax TaxID=35708 RepID=A0A0A8ZDI2_ARUDO
MTFRGLITLGNSAIGLATMSSHCWLPATWL